MSTKAWQATPHVLKSRLLRAALFLIFWLMISGWDPKDLPIGLVAVAAATWTSLRLLPPGKSRLQTLHFVALVQTFSRQSIVSGIDVAWRVMQPRVRLKPGFVSYSLHLKPGISQSAFCALSSMLPGTLPTGTDENGVLLVHCLDVDQPIAANLAAEEVLFTRVIGDD